ncbi:MAG: helix-turn-helix transcriptional regulator [Myxococcales bacterium]|nr:helix-turn-helix transcriptional regulator [Myxococcales bacterium]
MGRRRAPCAGSSAFTFVHDGRTYAAFRVDVSPPTSSDSLSPAEREVVSLALQGLSNEGIGLATGRAVSTVSNLLARAGRKLGARRRVDLARCAKDQGRP